MIGIDEMKDNLSAELSRRTSRRSHMKITSSTLIYAVYCAIRETFKQSRDPQMAKPSPLPKQKVSCDSDIPPRVTNTVPQELSGSNTLTHY